MRLADGFRWSRRRRRVEVFVRGRRLAWQAESEAREIQARGAFRHLVAATLIAYGWGVEDAATFACQKLRNAPYWITLQGALAA